MIDIEAIEETIEELENGETTMSVCHELASLYTIREHFKGARDTNQESDLATLLCDYMCMRDLYRLNALLGTMSDVISELYHTCDTSEELQEFHEFIERVSSITTPTVIERP